MDFYNALSIITQHRNGLTTATNEELIHAKTIVALNVSKFDWIQNEEGNWCAIFKRLSSPRLEIIHITK